MYGVLRKREREGEERGMGGDGMGRTNENMQEKFILAHDLYWEGKRTPASHTYPEYPKIA